MKLVVIGNGMVGQRFLEQLVARANGGSTQVTVLCEEPRPAYDRVQLTGLFSGKSAADLNVVPAGFLEQPGMTLRLDDKAVAIDPALGASTSASGSKSCSLPPVPWRRSSTGASGVEGG